ncbi:YxeA family protein [Bacillus thuringiensis]|uniref:YxeA family protein n=1 Tax=Bacillus thuringiensis TaxID=1428 RepID=A0AAW9GRY9_BACTU|nr:YxeA family protein [Bacillus thuringiensis]MDY0854371.1 YxeA family protein [Bacillus thuringiensis]MDY4393639.1 YxeA family protein [Bacillus thuringiensis]
MKYLLMIGLISIGGWYFLFSNHGYYSTKEYYVKITTSPEVVTKKASDGIDDTSYNYDVIGYDKDGYSKKLHLSSGGQYEMNQYYIIHWEERRGIAAKREKIDKQKIDKTILEKLNSNRS